MTYLTRAQSKQHCVSIILHLQSIHTPIGNISPQKI